MMMMDATPLHYYYNHPPITHPLPTGLNRRKLVQKAVIDELIRMVDPGTKPYQMKKGEL